MPYADPEKQRDAVKRWQQAHPEKLLAYRKTMFMKNSIAKHRFPKQRSIQYIYFRRRMVTGAIYVWCR